MKDFLAAVGLVTTCALVGAAPRLVSLWLSSRKGRSLDRALVKAIAKEPFVRWHPIVDLTEGRALEKLKLHDIDDLRAANHHLVKERER